MGKFFLYTSVFSVLLLLLFCPIVIRAHFYYQIRGKKVGVCLLLYGKFKLMGGYITTCPGGLAIHASEKRAILLKYRDMEKQRKNFSFCDLFTCKKVRLCIRTGPEYLLPVYTFSLVKNVVERITAREILDGEFWLEAGDELRIAAELILSFTIGKQLKALLKYLFGRIKKKWKMKKSTA